MLISQKLFYGNMYENDFCQQLDIHRGNKSDEVFLSVIRQ